MSREQAKQIGEEFFARRQQNRSFTIPFEEYVRVREAWVVVAGAEPDEIRRELEEEWGVPLD